MSETFKLVNTYQLNGQTPPKPGETTEFRVFYEAAEVVLGLTAELARVTTRSHQGAVTLLINGDWSKARKYFSLSEKYAQWADYNTPATGYGIHAYITKLDHPLRLTQAELEVHSEWRNFGSQNGQHPPMRGWLVFPLIGADGLNYGFVQVSDRYESDFDQQDQDNLGRLAGLTSVALDALAQTHFPDYRQKIEQAAKL